MIGCTGSLRRRQAVARFLNLLASLAWSKGDDAEKK
jgi:hypothetical protein